ncbi:alpha/beta hydrolase [Bermanella marisrubri]|uniref:Lysophospholipase n=1 Tax=Bermanella marisrubri TaxID=207949 RepID=Q1MZL1_9GAMM|nr:alpha/beta hydrolase [Bermanella marisrubri]EAT11400.1 Lysophospholipase [Oceanobacter sp. RED65] [Bermanella marisrubri]QIZ85601.1 alpha/beta hydrolase [Bermanella marisrubri]
MKWYPETVRQHVPKLDFSKDQADWPEDIQAYCQYYGLDLENRYKHVDHALGAFDAAGYTLVAHVYTISNAKGTVFIQHGYYDHVGIYNHLIEHCIEQGYNVFTYDLPGHGLSTGDRASINSFREYDDVFSDALERLQQHFTGPIVAIGQSTGGAIIINYLLSRRLDRHTSPFASIHLISPLVRPVAWRRNLALYYVMRPFVRQLKRKFAINSHNEEFLNFLSHDDPLQPLFLKTKWVGALRKWIRFIEKSAPVDLDINVIQGTEDGTVDYRHNMRILEEKFSGFHVHFVEQGRHHMVNEEPNKLNQMFQAMTPLVAGLE